MAKGTPAIELRDYLPSAFRAGEMDGDSFLRRFLSIFTGLFEELQNELDAIPYLFDPTAIPRLVGVDSGAAVPSTFLARHDISPSPDPDLARMREQRAKAFLAWLAGWVGLPHRPDKPAVWNATFIRTAIPLIPERGTTGGLERLLAAYLKGDVTKVQVSDEGGFVVGVSRLGVDSVLNKDANPPYHFTAIFSLAQGADRNEVERLARYLLDREAPAHAAYRINFA